MNDVGERMVSPQTGAALLSIKNFYRVHPEWWILAICATAWIALASQQYGNISTGVLCLGSKSGWTVLRWNSVALDFAEWRSHITCWSLMVLAMMLPLAIRPIRHSAFSSLWRRRHRAIAGFALGFFSMWTLVGVAGFLLLHDLSIGGSAKFWAASTAFAAAAIWELTIYKRIALSGCGLTIPLRPRGWRADVDCLRFGVLHGRNCVANCWAVMLALSFLPNQLVPMAAVTGICAMERYRPHRNQRRETVALACVALSCAVVAYATSLRSG